MSTDELTPRDIYFRIVEIAKLFFDGKNGLTIDVLCDFDPTIEEFAVAVRNIARLIEAVSDEDISNSNISINARQCSLDLFRLAAAVREEDQEKVDKTLDNLGRYVNGPY